jgi:hypothetical protein
MQILGGDLKFGPRPCHVIIDCHPVIRNYTGQDSDITQLKQVNKMAVK